MNIQNIPRKDKVVKQAFYPKLDVLVLPDYSQIEYRLYAWYMAVQIGDERAAETFREGKDLHEEQARRIHETMGWEFETPLTDAQRQYGKTLNFAALYGGGIPTIVRQLGCDRDTARAIYDAFHEDNPLIGRWTWERGRQREPDPDTLNGQIVQTIRERETGSEPGYITTLWGRHLHPEEHRKALNALIQGGAADLMKQGMVNIHEWLASEPELRSHMVLSVHDEVGLDCPEEEVEYVCDSLLPLMSDPRLEEILPIEIDIKTTRESWAEAA